MDGAHQAGRGSTQQTLARAVAIRGLQAAGTVHDVEGVLVDVAANALQVGPDGFGEKRFDLSRHRSRQVSNQGSQRARGRHEFKAQVSSHSFDESLVSIVDVGVDQGHRDRSDAFGFELEEKRRHVVFENRRQYLSRARDPFSNSNDLFD